MADIKINIDGIEVAANRGQTIMEAADAAGIYIPRLCFLKGLSPTGACRVCTVKVGGRFQAACTFPVTDEMEIENETEELRENRRNIVEMLFAEGNHYCPFCEKSGLCELQALAYRFAITAPEYPYQWPPRELDATHPDLWLDRNRCILCRRCVKASRELDGKSVFGVVGRGRNARIEVNARGGMVETDAAAADRCFDACPVGALLRKRGAYSAPIGTRRFDLEPIGQDVESRAAAPGGKP
jgi:[NiFe] hydrogenase diaphorase moiety small subunit